MNWSTARNAALRERARKVIPGGMYGHQSTALLPAGFPQFFSRAEGTRLWDADGNSYIDFMAAFGPNLLGYRHPTVEAAVRRQAELGDTMTGPPEIMVELAERFVGMIGHADWVMFCKNGTDATSMALVVARAYAGRRKILVAEGAYHGSAPWCTPRPAGILPEDRAHLVPYRYNDAASLEEAFRAHRGDVAGVFATPFRHETFHDQILPDPVYAATARRLCDTEDALLIVDDVRAGFRLARDCSWAPLGVAPDLSTWGKLLGNGQPISALAGSERARQAAGSIFVTGSFWFSAVPMAAAIATLEEVKTSDYLERMIALGQALRAGLAERAAAFGFSLRQTGPAQMPQILFHDDPDMRLGYAWTEALLRYGVYMSPYHNMFMNAAMTEADIAQALDGAEQAFRELRTRRDSLGPNPNETVRARLQSVA
jgi:glutamate-1-semialdehyde 2,1-aminomutase